MGKVLNYLDAPVLCVAAAVVRVNAAVPRVVGPGRVAAEAAGALQARGRGELGGDQRLGVRLEEGQGQGRG